jgi:hypothetical protein
MVKIERIRDWSTLDTLRNDWDRLDQGRRMRSFTWARTAIDCFGKDLQPYVLVAKKNESIQAILPLTLESSVIRGRRLQLIGSGKACGDNLGLLALDNDLQNVSEAFAKWLSLADGPDAWDCLDLDGLQPSQSTTKALLNAFSEQDGWTVDRKSSPSCWLVSIEEKWHDYELRLSKRVRKILKEINDNFLSTGRAKLSVATTFEEAQQKLATIEALHQARWNERSIEGCFATDGFQNFLTTLLNHWWSQSIAFVATMQIEGQDAAGAFGFWEQDTLNVYLVGMDTKLAEHRPGWMLNSQIIKHAYQQGVRKVDFLRGDEDYKGRLGGLAIEQGRWLFTSPRLSSRVRRTATHRGIELRNWLRKLPLAARQAVK